MGGGRWASCSTVQHSLQRLSTLPGSFWVLVDLLTATSDFLGRYSPPGYFSAAASWAKAGHRSQGGGIPLQQITFKRRAAPYAHLCQLPATHNREHSGGNAPIITSFHRCDGEELLLWVERDRFQGFLCLWCQPFTTTRWTCATCGVAECLTGEWDKQGKANIYRYLALVPSLPKEHGAQLLESMKNVYWLLFWAIKGQYVICSNECS